MKKVLLVASLISITIAQQIDTLYVDDSDGFPYFQYESFEDAFEQTFFGWNGTSYYLARNNPEYYGHNATWKINIINPDHYALYFYIPETSNSRDRVLWVINRYGMPLDSLFFDQNENSGNWILMGIYYFNEGDSNFVK